jgi:hypothetical protein
MNTLTAGKIATEGVMSLQDKEEKELAALEAEILGTEEKKKEVVTAAPGVGFEELTPAKRRPEEKKKKAEAEEVPPGRPSLEEAMESTYGEERAAEPGAAEPGEPELE